MDEKPPIDDSSKAAEDILGAELSIDQVIADRYKVKSLIARGGMGLVYRVEQIYLRKEFALKTLNPTNVSDAAWRRFQKEARAASLLDHPALIKVHDFGMIDDRQPFFVMDFFEGETLGEYVKNKGLLSVDEGINIFLQVCFGLAYAHSKHVIHRDIKPSNIMLKTNMSGPPEVRIVDFGIAKLISTEDNETLSLTQTGEVFGTPYYMSPEQCLGTKLDHRSDIYSLGCVMFEAFTGHPPCIGENALSIMMKHQTEEPPTMKEASLGLEFPESLEKIIAKMIVKKPDYRYQNLFDVARDLNRFKLGKPVEVRSLSEPVKSAGNNSAPVMPMSAAVTVALLTAALGFCAGRLTAPQPLAATPQAVQESRLPPVEPLKDHNTSAEEATSAELYRPAGHYFSEVRGSNRTFRFPRELSVGSLINMSTKTKLIKGADTATYAGVMDAQGDVVAENFAPLGFAPNRYSSEHLILVLRRFRPGELNRFDMQENPFAYDGLLKEVAEHSDLTSINMRGSRHISNAGLNYLGKLPNLTALGVSDTQVTVDGLLRFKRLLKLKRLNCDQLQGVRRLIIALKSSPCLEQLLLRGTNLKDDDLELIAEIKTLKQVDVGSNADITNRGLAYLCRLPALETLSCTNDGITAGCIPYLKQLKHLKQVALHFDNWSKADFLRLQLALPGVTISKHHIQYADL